MANKFKACSSENRKRAKAPNGSRISFINEIAVPFVGDECLEWPYARDQQGYAGMQIGRKSTTASRLVCTIVHGDPPSLAHQAAHSCGNGHLGCVNPGHLSWKTAAENMADKIGHGTQLRGNKIYGSKLTEEEIISIRMLKGQKSQAKIAAMYGISQPMVSSIHSGTKWAWLA